MADQGNGQSLTHESGSSIPAAEAARSRFHLKVGSRVGVWGLVGGLGTMTAGTLGAPISLEAAFLVMGGGVLLSGLGTLLAATAALRSPQRLPALVRTSALVGLPLGGVLGLLGITSLTQWGPLVGIVNALTPAAGILGALVVVLLVLGFFINPISDDEDAVTDFEGAP